MDIPEDFFLNDPLIRAIKENKELILEYITSGYKKNASRLLPKNGQLPEKQKIGNKEDNEDLEALRRAILEEEEPSMAMGIWDGFHAKMEASAEAEIKEAEERELENHLTKVRQFWDILIMKLWPEDVPGDKPSYRQKLRFLNEIMPKSTHWQSLTFNFRPSQKQIPSVHSGYEKVTEYNVLWPSHKNLIEKCKALGLIK